MFKFLKKLVPADNYGDYVDKKGEAEFIDSELKKQYSNVIMNLFDLQRIPLEFCHEMWIRSMDISPRPDSLPRYIQSVNFFRDFILNNFEKDKDLTAQKFTRIIINQNYLLIDSQIDILELNLFNLKTKKGRLNNIARFRNNFNLYADYFDKNNLEYLEHKIKLLEKRYRINDIELGGDVK